METRAYSPLPYTALHHVMRDYVMGSALLAACASTPTVALFGSARTASNAPLYEAARQTARLLAEAGFGIITGGGPGIMEAANRGAREGGARSLGCPIQLARAEPANPYLDVVIPFAFFAPRKATLLAAACAFVVFPGGFGTLDELFEVLVAMQTHKLAPVPLVLYGREFWRGMVEWLRQALLAAGMIDADDLHLLRLTDEPGEIVTHIRAWHEQSASLVANPALPTVHGTKGAA